VLLDKVGVFGDGAGEGGMSRVEGPTVGGSQVVGLLVERDEEVREVVVTSWPLRNSLNVVLLAVVVDTGAGVRGGGVLMPGVWFVRGEISRKRFSCLRGVIRVLFVFGSGK
jgi:hypothetical protein